MCTTEHLWTLKFFCHLFDHSTNLFVLVIGQSLSSPSWGGVGDWSILIFAVLMRRWWLVYPFVCRLEEVLVIGQSLYSPSWGGVGDWAIIISAVLSRCRFLIHYPPSRGDAWWLIINSPFHWLFFTISRTNQSFKAVYTLGHFVVDNPMPHSCNHCWQSLASCMQSLLTPPCLKYYHYVR